MRRYLLGLGQPGLGRRGLGGKVKGKSAADGCGWWRRGMVALLWWEEPVRQARGWTTLARRSKMGHALL